MLFIKFHPRRPYYFSKKFIIGLKKGEVHYFYRECFIKYGILIAFRCLQIVFQLHLLIKSNLEQGQFDSNEKMSGGGETYTNFSSSFVVYFWTVNIAIVIAQKCWCRGEGVHLEMIFNKITLELYTIIVSYNESEVRRQSK